MEDNENRSIRGFRGVLGGFLEREDAPVSFFHKGYDRKVTNLDLFFIGMCWFSQRFLPHKSYFHHIIVELITEPVRLLIQIIVNKPHTF